MTAHTWAFALCYLTFVIAGASVGRYAATKRPIWAAGATFNILCSLLAALAVAS